AHRWCGTNRPARTPSTHTRRHQGSKVQGPAMQSHLAGGEPTHVEQVLDEAREVLDLPIDDGARTLSRRLLGLRVLQDSAGVGDGPERIAQLMPEHGEELVLRAVRPL